jgi:hypothetical protein
MKDRVKWNREKGTRDMTSSEHFGRYWRITDKGPMLELYRFDIKSSDRSGTIAVVLNTKRNFKRLWNRVNGELKALVDTLLERK